jgi:hypothetical protein
LLSRETVRCFTQAFQENVWMVLNDRFSLHHHHHQHYHHHHHLLLLLLLRLLITKLSQ